MTATAKTTTAKTTVAARPLGTSGLSVSEIGFGAWGIGGRTAGATSYGATDDAVSLRALRAALDQGITFYDTSCVYGDGHSEALIGRAFAGCRDRVVIATKAGYRRFDEPPDFTPEALRRSLEGSLRRLGTGWVDLFQLHNPPATLLDSRPEIMGTLQDLRAAGLVRAIGVSAKSPEEALAILRRWRPDAVQANLNMMDLRVLDCGLLDEARRLGVGLIARTPLAFGYLSGRVPAEADFAPGDHRAGWPEAQRALWAEGARKLAEAVPCPPGQAPGQTPVQVALRFCLSFDAVSTVIPGILTPEEAAENAAASAAGPLPAAALEAVRRINRERSFVVPRG